jgi:hypothetical protein
MHRGVFRRGFRNSALAEAQEGDKSGSAEDSANPAL